MEMQQTKQVKIQDVQGKALDYLVAKCEGATDEWSRDKPFFWNGCTCIREGGSDVSFNPSSNWGHGGPIVEREGLCVGRRQQADPAYCPLNDPRTICWARTAAGGYLSYGPAPLVAAMRCYVASKLGDVVEVPACLL